MKAKLALLLALVMTLSLSAPTDAAPADSAATVAGTESGDGGTGPNQLASPQGLAVDSNGNLYISDAGNGRIQKVTFDTDGNPTGTTTLTTGALLWPDGIAFGPDGDLYVVEQSSHRVTRFSFDNNGTPTGTTTVAGSGGQGSAADQLSTPIGIAIDSNGNLYIADQINNRIQKVTFDTNGNPTGTTTVTTGPLLNPADVALDSNGNLYIADHSNHRIQKVTFDTNGNPTGTTTVAGSGGQGFAADQLNSPIGIAIDSNGNLYVTDQINNRIQKVTFDTNGNPTGTTTLAGGNGHGHAANQLDRPRHVVVDNNGNLYIADQSNNRVQRVQLDITKPSTANNTNDTKVGTAKTINYTCADTNSGINTCTATLNGQSVNNGDPLNTDKRGSHALVVTATDNAGNTTTQTHTITVHGKRELTGNYSNATGTNASVARLYMATFKRAPEGKGFDFWVTAHSNGKTLQAMADFFVTDQEFRTLYGNTSNAQFVDLMYQNVMGRAPGTKAKAFWLNDLDTGHRTRAQMLLWFAESTEFKILTHTS